MNSLGVFLGQELIRFNGLVEVMKATLHELQRAIKGEVVMSGELELMYNSFVFQKVPATWEDAGYECSWFTFSHVEEVEISQTVTKLDSENKYANGMNWKNVGIPYANSRLRKVNTNSKGRNVKKSTKLPINPRTGLRDGGV